MLSLSEFFRSKVAPWIWSAPKAPSSPWPETMSARPIYEFELPHGEKAPLVEIKGVMKPAPVFHPNRTEVTLTFKMQHIGNGFYTLVQETERTPYADGEPGNTMKNATDCNGREAYSYAQARALLAEYDSPPSYMDDDRLRSAPRADHFSNFPERIVAPQPAPLVLNS